MHQLRFSRWQLLQLADVRVDPLNHAAVGKMLAHRIEDNLPQLLAVEGLRERLHREYIVVFVEDEAGQQVGLAEDYAVGISVAHDLLAELHRAGDAFAQQQWELRFGDFFAAQQTYGDLRGAAVQRRTQLSSALISHVNQRSGRSVGWRHEVGAINPQMSAAQPRCATVIDPDDWNGVGQSVLAGKNQCLYYAGTVIAMRPATAQPLRLLGALPLPIWRRLRLCGASLLPLLLPPAWAAAERNTGSAGRNRR